MREPDHDSGEQITDAQRRNDRRFNLAMVAVVLVLLAIVIAWIAYNLQHWELDRDLFGA